MIVQTDSPRKRHLIRLTQSLERSVVNLQQLANSLFTDLANDTLKDRLAFKAKC